MIFNNTDTSRIGILDSNPMHDHHAASGLERGQGMGNSLDEDAVESSDPLAATVLHDSGTNRTLMNHTGIGQWAALCTVFILSFLVLSASQLARAQAPAPKPEAPANGPHFFVPLEHLQTLIQQDHKWVLLNQAEFKRLKADAATLAGQPQPPAAIGVRDVKYAGRIEEDQFLITATMELTKFAPGWQLLPLEFTDLSVEKAVLNDQPARLGRDPSAGNRLTLVLDQPGKQTLTLELSRPLVAVGSDKLVTFGLPRQSGVEFTLNLAAQKHLQWNGLAIDRPAPNDQPATFQLALGGQKQIELKITDRPTQQVSEGLVFAHTAIGVRAAPEEVTWQAITSLQVFGKPLDQLQFRVPEAMQIVSITSPGLESWEFGPMGPENGETILNLRYRQPFQEPRDITFQGVMAAKTSEGWLVPGLKLASVASHTSEILVTSAPGMRLQVEEAVGVQRTAVTDPPSPTATGGMRFTAWREDFALRFTTQAKAREISAAIATLLDITSSGLNLTSNATVETRFAPLFDVSMTVPAEWTVIDVLVNNERVTWETIPQEAGLHQLRIPFKTLIPVDQQVVIQLKAHRDPEGWPIEEGQVAIQVPEVRLLQSNVVEGTLMVSAEPDLDVEAEQLKGLTPAVLDKSVSAQLAYEYQDTRYSGQIQVKRKPSRVSAQTLAFHRLDRETLLSHLEARLEVLGGGTRKLVFSLPEAAGTNLRFELSESLSRIVEQTAAEPANGRRIWTLLLDQRTRGHLLAVVDVSTPRQQAKEFVPPTIQVVGAERETGSVAFEAEPDQQLDLVATTALDKPLADVDPADLIAPTGYFPKERIVAAYGYVLPGYQLKLTERRFDRLAVPTAICDTLNLVSILGETGEFQHEATFRLRAVGVQSLQVALPEGAQLWATLIDGVPIEVRHASDAYLIPLSTAGSNGSGITDDANQVRTLKLFYRTDAGVVRAASTLVETPPSMTVLNGDGTVQPLEILHQEWTVHHPATTEFISSPGSFQTQQLATGSSYLGQLLSHFEVDTPNKLLWKAITLLLIAGGIWIARMVVRQTGVRGLAALGACLLGIWFLTYMVAVQDFSTAKYASDGSKPAATAAPATANTMFGGTTTTMEMDTWHALSPDESVRVTTSATTPNQPTSPESKNDFTPPSAGSQPRGFRFGRNGAPGAGDPFQAGDADELKAKLDDLAQIEKKMDQKPEEEKTAAPNEPPQAAPKDEPQATPAPSPATPSAPPAPPVGQPGGLPVIKQFAEPNAPPNRPQGDVLPQGNELDGQAVRRLGRQPSGSGAVLSLALQLEPPADAHSTTFAYRGRVGATPAKLAVTYQNRNRLSFVMLMIQFVVILICWNIRNRSLALRVLCVALGLALPLAAITVVPPSWLRYLDGLFLGTIWGGAILVLHGTIKSVQRQTLTTASLWSALNRPLTSRFGILAVLGLSLTGTSLQAQEQAPGRLSGVQQAATPVTGRSPLSSPPANTLVVPLTVDLDPEQAERVFLPYDKFLELWQQGHPNEPLQGDSPIPGVMSEALYVAELLPPQMNVKPAVKVTARFVCYSLRKGQITLPLPVGKIALISAKLDGATAPLVQGQDALPYSVVISQPGTHLVDVEFTVPAELTGPAGKFSLQLGESPAGLLRFKSPAPELTFRVNSSSGAFRRSTVGEDQFILIPISKGGEVLVTWRPQQGKGEVEGIVHVDSTTGLILADDGTRLISDWNLQVRQGALTEILYALPAALGVRKIEGADLGGWEIVGEDEERQLKVFFRGKVEDSTQLKFDLFVKQPADDLETTYAIPQFAPVNVTRETGTVAVLADKQFSVRTATSTGLSQIEPQLVPLQRLGPGFTGANVLSYRFAARPWELEIVSTRRQPQLKVQVQHHSHIDPRRIQILSRLRFTLTGAPRSSLGVLIPQGYLLQDVQAADASDWHISGREDSAQMDAEAMLFLEFAAPRTGQVDVVLIGKTLRQPEVMKAEINLPYPLEVDEGDTQLLTTLDPIYLAQVGNLDNWKSIDPNGLSQQFLNRDAASGQFGFTTSAPAPATILLDLQQQIPKLSASAMTLLTVGEASLEYLFALQWKIDSAGAESFVFTTPESLAGRLEFPDGNGPRRRSIQEEPTGNGRIRWTVTLEDPQRDRFFLVARTVLPPSADGRITAPSLVFEHQLPGQDPPLIERLETQSQFVVLVNQSQTQLTSDAGDNVETVSPEDLLQIIKLRQDLIHQAAEIVRVKNPLTPVVWKQERFKAEQLLPASVNLAHHVTVLAADGSWREQVSYHLRNRVRQFLAVRLPPDSQVLSLFVKGVPARPVQLANATGQILIPLPKTTEGDVSFEVHLVLAGQLPGGPLPREWALWRRQIEIPVPSVISPEENREYGIPVAQATWTVYAPEELDVDLIQGAISTNVQLVSDTLQAYDQTSALLSDVSELIAVNSSTFNRRAKAQSLNNLKQLNTALTDVSKANPSASTSQERARQQDLERRVSQLQESIDKLVVSNSAVGITITNDAAGNGIVVDQRAGQTDQSLRVQELYSDNGGNGFQPADRFIEDFETANSAPAKAQSGKKGNLNRGVLRGRNESQIQALSESQQRSAGQQQLNSELQQNPNSNNRAYFFNNFHNGITPQFGTGATFREEFAAPGTQGGGTFLGLPGQMRGGQLPNGPGQNPILPGQGAAWQATLGAAAQGQGLPANGEQGGFGLGGMGGMGGGMGGQPGAAGNAMPLGDAKGVELWFDNTQSAVQTWSSTGGLSLLIEIPKNGQKLSFSKVGGDPKLALAVRPHQTWQLALGFLWTAIWGIIILVIIATVRSANATAQLTRRAPWFVAGLGLVVYFLIPTSADWGVLGLIAFVLGALWIGFQEVSNRRHGLETASD